MGLGMAANVLTNRCKDCKHYSPECYYSEGDPIKWRKWGNCTNPKLDIDKSEIIRAGGSDGDGDHWHMTGDFGCVFFEGK